MDKFKAEIQSRNKKVMLAASIIFFIYIFLSRKTGVPTASNDFATGYHLGLFIALQVGAIYFIATHNKALKSNVQLKELYIKEKDERKKLIRHKSSLIGMSLFVFILLVATIIAGFYNLIVFYTLVGVCLVVFVILISTKLYFLKRI